MAEIPLKATAAFVMALDGKGHETNCEWLPISYLHIKFKQNWSINGRDTFKGCCGLCLTFDDKDHVINRSQVPISYLHTKFERNLNI